MANKWRSNVLSGHGAACQNILGETVCSLPNECASKNLEKSVLQYTVYMLIVKYIAMWSSAYPALFYF